MTEFKITNKCKYAVGKFCIVCGKEAYAKSKSNTEYKDKLVCRKHHNQLHLYNSLVPSIKDRNVITTEGPISYIILKNKNHEIIGKTMIDTEDIPKIKNFKWNINHRYVCTMIKQKRFSLHTVIMNFTKGIDHINGDRFNNCKSNLRKATQQQNCWNKALQKNNQYGYQGIHFRDNKWGTAKKKWYSTIGVNNKIISLGRFSTKEEAITARKNAEIRYYGDYRCQR